MQPSLSYKDLTQLALDLTSEISSSDRFERLLTTVRNLLNCDASALLVYQQQKFLPLAINGLTADVRGRHFAINEHPRLEAIARAGDIVRFPADSDLPDPYDSLIESHEGELKVHACIGLPLIANERLIGALTIDGFDPHLFDSFSNDDLRMVSALASASLNNALMMVRLEKLAAGNSPEASETNKSGNSMEMVGESSAMNTLKKEISVVATTDMTALILGETGTGKELVAANIHHFSTRASQPMVYLNCAALPESVAESELFGHVKGAFTGAISNRKGKFELADKGTLFLDEVGELSLSLQSKLLRVLQYGDLQRVGDDRSLKVNTRIVAATNRDLKQEVMDGHFRADLYHRLSVFPVHVPPLREREQDVLLLSGFFIEKSRGQLGLEHLSLDSGCQNLLLSYSWPGNVRELEHAIHRAAILAKAECTDKYLTILPRHFALNLTDTVDQPAASASHPHRMQPVKTMPGEDLKTATDEFQRHLIKQTLEEHQGNWAATARALGIDAGNLHRLGKRLAIKS
ncbi:nitric oxide reductase transcriptional regulator NorR [Endozoicomonas sp. OPT23]|uniref:nitric oxide reductase transcriptional regulator NorR n=1 Tax=Endozoicomonas sp. OPT23 TaxID=2072845 RepID=UPI00129C080B|nr:nitric oxide reductase transcriptional regulator NorR [Endozoicomonas sp. OPT23]MRI35186.1 nitric oxide reductase transcriptional regulator NorR [Endozoicomonas sp. OPT23]